MSRRAAIVSLGLLLASGALTFLTWNTFVPPLLYFCAEFPYRQVLIVALGALAATCLLAGREKS